MLGRNRKKIALENKNKIAVPLFGAANALFEISCRGSIMFCDWSPWKYGIWPGSNSRPLDQLSGSLHVLIRLRGLTNLAVNLEVYFTWLSVKSSLVMNQYKTIWLFVCVKDMFFYRRNDFPLSVNCKHYSFFKHQCSWAHNKSLWFSNEWNNVKSLPSVTIFFPFVLVFFWFCWGFVKVHIPAWKKRKILIGLFACRVIVQRSQNNEKIRTSKGDNCIKQWFSTIMSLFKGELLLKVRICSQSSLRYGKSLLPH